MEQLNKELKEDLKNKVLDHEKVEKSYQDLEKKLRAEITKKDEKIDNLAAENEDLKNEIEALKFNLEIKEKRSNSYFGLNEELKSEIKSLKEQIVALEASKNELEKKVDLKSNMSEQGEHFLKELTDKYSKIKKNQQSNEAKEPAKKRSYRERR